MGARQSGIRIDISWNPRTKEWRLVWAAWDGSEVRRGATNIDNSAPLDDGGVRLLVRSLVHELESRLPLY
jgi:hypothetical protein